MGLDIVEYIMAVENAFEIVLPDDRLSTVGTPRELAALVAEFVTLVDSGPCLSQRAFYRLRQAMQNQIRLPRRAITPESVVVDLLPTAGTEERWTAISADLDLQKPLGLRGRDGFFACLGVRPTTVGDAVAELMMGYPRRLLPAGHGWTMSQIHALLAQLLDREQGIAPGTYSLDARYVQDLQMD